MPIIGKFKSIVVLLLALCLLASLFYLKVWSSIETEEENSPNTLSKAETPEGKEVLFRQHHHHINQIQQPSYNTPVKQQDGKSERPLSAEQLEKQHLKELKEQRKLEKAERARKKEEKRLRQAAKLQKIQQLDKEPFPALISTNNARLAALNLKAFAKFCHIPEAEDGDPEYGAEAEWEVGSSGSITAEDGQGRRLILIDRDFETYEEWTDYIYNKNSGQEQEQEQKRPLPIPSELNQDDSELQLLEEQQGDEPTILQLEQRKSKTRPLFWERPLRDWIVNHTAILEPCDRTKHTSAHCLAFLSHDHLYLVPSRASRQFPNKLHNVSPSNNARSQEDIELDTFYNKEKGTISTSSTSAARPTIMHFHIFWRGVISDKVSLAAHAFLFTQPLDRARLHLWIDSTDLPDGRPEDYEKNPFAKDLVSEPLNKFVKLHVWDQEAQETHAYAIQGSEVKSNKAKSKVPPVALSDQARFMILHRYGGMYLDADVLLLRDMSPLYDSGMEFAYEWSNTQMYNTAVLRLDRKSSVARRILDGAKAKEKEIQGKEVIQDNQEQGGELVQNEGDSETGAKSSIPEGMTNENKQDKEIESSQEVDDDKSILEAKRRTRGRPKQQPKQPSEQSQVLEPFIADTTGPNLQEIVPPVQTNLFDGDYLGPDEGDESIFDSPLMGLYTSTSQPRLTKRSGEMRPKEIYHPARLRHYLSPDDGGNSIENNGLIMMPTAIFDPLWLRIDRAESSTGLTNDKRYKMMQDLYTFPDAFTNSETICPAQQDQAEGRGNTKSFTAGPEVFFTGAFAYHWHNNWMTPIKPHSWMGLMRQAYRDFLAGERPNLYGEWFRDDSDIAFKK
ncbi:hypothetical protein BGX27_006984 [Mortierella sp. AM989]|nr:hypothetical protein BGX27_006984 [Mortierella sp. AM989]